MHADWTASTHARKIWAMGLLIRCSCQIRSNLPLECWFSIAVHVPLLTKVATTLLSIWQDWDPVTFLHLACCKHIFATYPSSTVTSKNPLMMSPFGHWWRSAWMRCNCMIPRALLPPNVWHGEQDLLGCSHVMLNGPNNDRIIKYLNIRRRDWIFEYSNIRNILNMAFPCHSAVGGGGGVVICSLWFPFAKSILKKECDPNRLPKWVGLQKQKLILPTDLQFSDVKTPLLEKWEDLM